MRQLKISSQKSTLPPLSDVQEEYKFIEAIARMYAGNFQELQDYYKIGMNASTDFKEKCVGETNNQYERFVAWVVKQAILSEVQKTKP